jgi:diketogulonate reductase-like aldo/keto reductase
MQSELTIRLADELNVAPLGAIPGAKNEHQARQNAGALGWEMSADEAEKLNLATLGWRWGLVSVTRPRRRGSGALPEVIRT